MIEIRVLDNLSVGKHEDLGEVCNFQVIKNNLTLEKAVYLQVGDIRNYEVCHQAVQGVDCLIHLAANTGVELSIENPREDM